MTGIIEWTHDSQCAVESTDQGVGLPRWDSDLVHGVLFETGKEYDFFAAIAGVQNRFQKAPLISPRGWPPNLSFPAERYLERHGDDGGEPVGWLHLSEIDLAIEHMRHGSFHMGFELEIMLDFMRVLVDRLSDPHVRLVFNLQY